MRTTLKTLFEQYAGGEVTLGEAKARLNEIAWPEKRTENGETWYDGEQDNTVIAVQATLTDRKSRRKFEEFLTIL